MNGYSHEFVVVRDIVVHVNVFEQAPLLGADRDAVALKDIVYDVVINFEVVRVLVPGVNVYSDEWNGMHGVPMHGSV